MRLPVAAVFWNVLILKNAKWIEWCEGASTLLVVPPIFCWWRCSIAESAEIDLYFQWQRTKEWSFRILWNYFHDQIRIHELKLICQERWKIRKIRKIKKIKKSTIRMIEQMTKPIVTLPKQFYDTLQMTGSPSKNGIRKKTSWFGGRFAKFKVKTNQKDGRTFEIIHSKRHGFDMGFLTVYILIHWIAKKLQKMLRS